MICLIIFYLFYIWVFRFLHEQREHCTTGLGGPACVQGVQPQSLPTHSAEPSAPGCRTGRGLPERGGDKGQFFIYFYFTFLKIINKFFLHFSDSSIPESSYTRSSRTRLKNIERWNSSGKNSNKFFPQIFRLFRLPNGQWSFNCCSPPIVQPPWQLTTRRNCSPKAPQWPPPTWLLWSKMWLAMMWRRCIRFLNKTFFIIFIAWLGT